MKKIGIMTMQRIYNYGSFLQAYGLKKNIEELGYNVQFVDYKEEPPVITIEKGSLLTKIKHNKNIVNYLKRRKFEREFRKMYNESLKKVLGISEVRNYAYNNIDQLVIGSDEVFNCTQGSPVGYSKELFGKKYEKKNIISYAASFGYTTLRKLEEHNIDKEVGKMLSEFKAISVRDQNSFNIVKKISKVEPTMNLDPVLITDYTKEKSESVKYSNYILLYVYLNRLSDNEARYISNFAKKLGKEIISIGNYQAIADHNIVVDPFETFAYFKNADFVITDTFHGSILSIKEHSNYAVFVRNGKSGNNNKLLFLLKQLKQTNRIINELTDIDKLLVTKNNYIETDKIIENERKKSIDYLKKNLIK